MSQRCPDALTLGFAIEGTLSHLGRMTGGCSNCTTVVDGTGRFAGATGQFSIEGLIDLSGPTVAGTVTGWLSY